MVDGQFHSSFLILAGICDICNFYFNKQIIQKDYDQCKVHKEQQIDLIQSSLRQLHIQLDERKNDLQKLTNQVS
jgi:hypothetical protein